VPVDGDAARKEIMASALRAKLAERWEFLSSFRSPLFVFLLRIGWVRLAYYEYRVREGKREYRVLARPTANSGGDLSILRDILVHGAYGDILQHLPASPLKVVDLGANIGAFVIWLAKHCSIAQGFCFEPDPESNPLCRFNLDRNGCSHVELFRLAVGGTSRSAEIWVDLARPARSTLFPRRNQGDSVATKIQVVSFDEWSVRMDGDFDLLKCDIEGAEWELLEQCGRTLKRFRRIIAEIHRIPARAESLDAFPARMEELGFRTVRWDACDNGIYIGTRDAPSA
jgi:FkbM family methyltransferase